MSLVTDCVIRTKGEFTDISEDSSPGISTESNELDFAGRVDITTPLNPCANRQPPAVAVLPRKFRRVVLPCIKYFFIVISLLSPKKFDFMYNKKYATY